MFDPIGIKATLSQQVEQEIQKAIIKGKFVAGSKLPTEHELCESFGISRNALREALKSLESKGLIKVKKGSGMYVRQFSIKNAISNVNIFLEMNTQTDEKLFEVIRLRQMFEPQIVAEACIYREDSDLTILSNSIEQLRECPPDDLSKEALIDNQFHKQICLATRNIVLQLIMEPIYEIMPKFKSAVYAKHHGMKTKTLEFHIHILEAISERDSAKASDLMKTHLKQTESSFYEKQA